MENTEGQSKKIKDLFLLFFFVILKHLFMKMIISFS